MGDNDTMTCPPIQNFPPAEFPSANSNLYSAENQNSLTQNDEKKDSFGTKEGIQNSPINLPKRFDESQDSQDDLPNPDLHNGHNNPDAINISHRVKSLGELLQESEDLPDAVLMDEYSSAKETEQVSDKAKEEKEEAVMKQEESNSESQENSEQEKTQDDSVSQDFFDDMKEPSNDKNNKSNQDTELSQDFDLHLSETQSFLAPAEKGNDNQNVSESEEESQNATENEKDEVANEGSDDVEMSNASSSNQDATDSTKETELEKVAEEDKDDSINEPKPEIIKNDSEESLSNGEVPKTENEKIEHNEEEKKTLDGDHCKIDSKASDESEEVKENDKGTEDEMSSKEEKPLPAATRVSSRQQLRKQAKQEETKDTSNEKNSEPMEVESSANEAPSEPEESFTNTSETVMKKISRHLNSACAQLDEFIKLKRREENKVLKNFLDMLKEIQSISENKEIKGESKISEHILIPEETPAKRKASKRKSNDLDTPLKETPRKRAAEEKSAKKTAEKKSNIDFKDLKGLAVFAKWPNSGWYYPGKVEELSGNDWKDVSNVTVKFYDGLVRDMKNINILPAYLIPAGSLLCDLEDETEMIVLSCDGSNQNSVDFKLSTKDSSEEVELNFNKLAIRANNMKTIKQQLEATTDVAAKKMHMVSLDNLVSGRRSRGRSKKDDSDSEEKTTGQTERRSRSSSSSTPAKKVSTTRRGRN